jgi:hypothetical protein
VIKIIFVIAALFLFSDVFLGITSRYLPDCAPVILFAIIAIILVIFYGSSYQNSIIDLSWHLLKVSMIELNLRNNFIEDLFSPWLLPATLGLSKFMKLHFNRTTIV